MENLTKEQIEQKKEQLKKLLQEADALKEELVAAGEWPIDDDDLDNVAGMGLLSMDIFGKFR